MDVGRRGERIAEKHLKHLGYPILERNLRVGRNEIDLLALDGDTLCFCRGSKSHLARACFPGRYRGAAQAGTSTKGGAKVYRDAGPG